MSHNGSDTAYGHEGGVDLTDRSLTNKQILTEGLRRDDIEIVHYEPQFPVPGTKAEKRVERTIALIFLIAFLAAAAFFAVYIWGPFKPDYTFGSDAGDLYTPLLGFTAGLALLALGIGVLAYGKKLLPHEIAIQQRHDGSSTEEDRTIAGGTLGFIGSEFGIQRRPLIKATLGLAGLGLTLGGGAIGIGMLLKNPHPAKKGASDPYFETGYNAARFNNGNPVRLTRDDRSPIKPADVSVGGQMTAFPGVPGGTTNDFADSPVLLIHLRDEDAATLRSNLHHYSKNALENPDDPNSGGMWNSFVAYSKICTHAGCPASLYEQQTNRLLCPCHQSQFLITDNARPVFGPATRRLPMLPITVDDQGFFVAKRDFGVAIGPAFWERPTQ
jgi:ubiquinol-cytochrome c reductase iron-sulfur subunit